MNTLLKLTERERRQIRDALFEEKKSDWLFVADAINEANNLTGTLILNAFKEREALPFLEAVERAVKERIESELAEEAENEVLASKEINGKRYYEA